MALTNHIKEILGKAERWNNVDNRSLYTKSVNQCLEQGLVKIYICQKGQVWQNDSKTKKWNIVIKGFGYKSTAYISGTIETIEILTLLGKFLNDENIKKRINVTIPVSCDCPRCHGKGIIPQFHYFCSGICFQCYGSGRDVQKITI